MAALRRLFVERTPAVGYRLVLDGAVRKHARVLRLDGGDEVILFDGSGAAWRARVVSTATRSMDLQVIAEVEDDVESPLRITVAQGLARGNRMDEVIRHGTELGVVAFVPVLCARSTKRAGNDERWQRIAADAARQCGRSVVPGVSEVVPLEAFLAAPPDGLRLLLSVSCGVTAMLAEVLPAHLEEVAVLVGPEGGFEDAEIDAAQRAGFEVVGMGPRVLRTETAALAAVAAIQFARGDWG
jgi:16S rRNA (uracil1498-N3)-methyltransferase